MFTIDQHSRQPIYEQLKEQIIRYVSLGVLQPQDRMPSVRILARELGINPNTVVKTYQELDTITRLKLRNEYLEKQFQEKKSASKKN